MAPLSPQLPSHPVSAPRPSSTRTGPLKSNFLAVNNLLLSRADVTKDKEIDLTAKPPGEGDVVTPEPGKEAVPTPENPPGQ